MKLPSSIFGGSDGEKRQELINSLIRYEAKLGGKLFGAVPANGRREFFCLGNRTWVWHEEWTDANSERKSRTTRYIVRASDIIKTSGDGNYQRLSDDEVRRLYQAAKLYQQKTHEAYQKILAPAV